MTDTSGRDRTTLVGRFLHDARESNRALSIYLVNGYQLKGEVVEFDEESMLVNHKDTYQMVMRSAVASIYPLPDPKQKSDGWWRGYTPETAET